MFKRASVGVMTLAAVLAVGAMGLRDGAVGVGDSPEMAFKAVDGRDVSLSGLKGKVVVVDFWATWCPPCMAEAENMVKLYADNKDKGVELIGISLDKDEAKLNKVVAEKNFSWPQHFDGQGWKNKFAVQFGVRSIPHCVIVDPTGKVAWVGHPEEIKPALAKVLKDTPPTVTR